MCTMVFNVQPCFVQTTVYSPLNNSGMFLYVSRSILNLTEELHLLLYIGLTDHYFIRSNKKKLSRIRAIDLTVKSWGQHCQITNYQILCHIRNSLINEISRYPIMLKEACPQIKLTIYSSGSAANYQLHIVLK
jgi:hypothetical protein